MEYNGMDCSPSERPLLSWSHKVSWERSGLQKRMTRPGSRVQTLFYPSATRTRAMFIIINRSKKASHHNLKW